MKKGNHKICSLKSKGDFLFKIIYKPKGLKSHKKTLGQYDQWSMSSMVNRLDG